MKKLMLYVALMLPMCLGAQQNVGFKKSQVEPLVINADKSVTFNVEAPKAKSVTIRGDWEANGGKGELKKGKDGVWSYTTPPLPSEMYTYRIDIDGVMNIAPDNPFSCRDVGNLFSQFFRQEVKLFPNKLSSSMSNQNDRNRYQHSQKNNHAQIGSQNPRNR